MSRNVRWTVILAAGAAAIGALLYSYSVLNQPQSTDASSLIVEQQWMLGMLVLYVVNFVVSARIRNSFSATAGRMLFFAVIAFIVLSHAIDILGEHRSQLPQVFSFEGSAVESSIGDIIRARIAVMAAMLSLCLACIGIGFETEDEVKTSDT